MKTEIAPLKVREIFIYYGIYLSETEVAEETVLINARIKWEGEEKTAEEIAHQYAYQRAESDLANDGE